MLITVCIRFFAGSRENGLELQTKISFCSIFDNGLSYPATDRRGTSGVGDGRSGSRVTPPNIGEKQKPLRVGGGEKISEKQKRLGKKDGENEEKWGKLKAPGNEIVNEL